MSSIWKPTEYSVRQLETQWMNNLFHSHDLFCSCKDPILHLLITINKSNAAVKPEEDIKNIKCLITGETTEDTKEENGGFDAGDLERLFENTEEETG